MNLKYLIQAKSGGKRCLAEIADLIKTKFKGQSGIVYCLSRKECDKVSQLFINGRDKHEFIVKSKDWIVFM